MDDAGQIKSITAKAYYIPDIRTHLLSPQAYFWETNGGEMLVQGQQSFFKWKDGAQMTIKYDPRSRLPIANAFTQREIAAEMGHINLCISDEVNQNLTPAQKLLLKWHFKLGHASFATL